jgi:hypothetical protein
MKEQQIIIIPVANKFPNYYLVATNQNQNRRIAITWSEKNSFSVLRLNGNNFDTRYEKNAFQKGKSVF